VTQSNGAEDYLPAAVEAAPGRAAAYADLGDYYAECGQDAPALADYARSLELKPAQPGIDDRVALILWKQGKRDDALARWHTALQSLARQLDRRLPESFTTDLGSLLQHIGARGLLPQLRPEIDSLLRTYIRRNGSYGSEPLLRTVFTALNDAQAGVQWILELSPQAADEAQLLRQMVRAPWMPEAQRAAIYQRILALAEAAVGRSEGDARQSAEQELQQWRVSWIEYLVRNKRSQQARMVIDELAPPARAAM